MYTRLETSVLDRSISLKFSLKTRIEFEFSML